MKFIYFTSQKSDKISKKNPKPKVRTRHLKPLKNLNLALTSKTQFYFRNPGFESIMVSFSNVQSFKRFVPYFKV